MSVITLNSGITRLGAHAFYEKQGFYKKSYSFYKKNINVEKEKYNMMINFKLMNDGPLAPYG